MMSGYSRKFSIRGMIEIHGSSDKISYYIFFITIILSAIGCIVLYHASGRAWAPWAYKQTLVFLCFGIIAIIITLISNHFFYDSAYYIYGICLLLLILASFFGHTAMGAQRWIRFFGFINIQPSEWMKLAIILALSKYFMRVLHEEVIRTPSLIVPCLIVLVPVILILKQPNLGTALIILFVAATIFFVTGVRIWKFSLLLIIFLACAPLAWKYALHDYQKQRIMILLNPETDLLGSGYNVMQSKIAIGSGALTGKGLAKGTQNQLNFLPEKHNDFIGSIIAEEIGFLGIALVLFLYVALLVLFYVVAIFAKDHYGSLVVTGIASMFFAHIFVNLAMISGVLPVVGMQLPLLSYGGSHLGMSLIAIGFVLNTRNASL